MALLYILKYSSDWIFQIYTKISIVIDSIIWLEWQANIRLLLFNSCADMQIYSGSLSPAIDGCESSGSDSTWEFSSK